MTAPRKALYLHRVHEQAFAILRALVPVAWADGDFAEKEKEMLDALLDAHEATPEEKKNLHEYAKEKRTLGDINLQELSAGDRRVLLQHAVLLSFADGVQHPAESTLITDLAARLRIPAEEATLIIRHAEARAKKNLRLLG